MDRGFTDISGIIVLIIHHDHFCNFSLALYLAKLIPTKDTLYNIRFYCKFKCGIGKELFIDKTGIIEYGGKCYMRNETIIKCILNKIPSKDREDYIPLWLDKK